jgi:GNAT superfamily N-acetyltransferase
MNMEITLRSLREDDIEAASRLVLEVFDEAIAPYYSPEGVRVFHSYASPEAMARRAGQEDHFTVLACAGDEIVGVAEVRDDHHVAMLFVSTRLQRGGVGRQLLRRVIETCVKTNPGLEALELHSSPNSVAAYETMGFVATGPERTVNGIRFTPMSLRLTGSTASV